MARLLSFGAGIGAFVFTATMTYVYASTQNVDMDAIAACFTLWGIAIGGKGFTKISETKNLRS
jgi:hypothetical protein